MTIILGECLYCKEKWELYAKNLEEYQEYLEKKEEINNRNLICPSCQEKIVKKNSSILIFPTIKKLSHEIKSNYWLLNSSIFQIISPSKHLDAPYIKRIELYNIHEYHHD